MEDKREVSYEGGKELSLNYGIPFFEVSAFQNININESIELLANIVYE